MTMSKVKSRSHNDVAHLQTLSNVLANHQLPILSGFIDSADKILKVKVIMARSKVKLRQHYEVAHLPPTNVPISTSYTLRFPIYTRTRFSNSRSLRQGQRSSQGHTMTLHTYTFQLMSLLSINFLQLTVSEIQPGENNTLTALKGCGQNFVSY